MINKVLTWILYIISGGFGIYIAYIICNFFDNKLGPDNAIPLLIFFPMFVILSYITDKIKE